MGSTTTFLSSGLTLAFNTHASRWLTYSTVLFADLIALTAAGAVAVFTRFFFGAQFTPHDYLTFTPSILLFVGVFLFSGLYPGVACSPIEEFRLILRASSIGFLLLITSTVFLRAGVLSSRIVLALAWFLAIVFVPLSRRTVRQFCSTRAWWGIPTVILGEPTTGVMMLELLQGHCRLGLRPVALLTDEPFVAASSNSTASIFVGDLRHAKRIGKAYPGCYALVAMPNSGSERIRAILSEHTQTYRNVLLVPDLFGMRSLSVTAKDMCGVLTLHLDQKLTQWLPRLLKRSFDLAIAIVVAALLSPVFLILWVLVRLSSKGPAFYPHVRIGRNGVPFKVWKFRSMVTNADVVLESHLNADPELRAEWERDHKLKRDPRVTTVGTALRKTSLDELPQLWNVLRGEMSLVGPRPIVHSEIERYGDSFEQYRLVTPGITGLWQISGRNNTSYEHRVRIDNYYVRNWSLYLDIYVLLRTVKTLLFSEGAY